MKGHYRKRGCKCLPNNCTCGKTWSFVIDVGKDPETGKRKQEFGSGFKTRQDAEAAAAALITEVNLGTFIKESNILFKEWANDWLPLYIERNGPKPGTIRLRQYSIKKLLPYFASIKLKNITEEMYQSALNDLKDQDFSISTIEGVHTTAKMIFKMAVSKKMLKIDPTTNAYIKKDEQIIIESDEEELPAFFEKEELALFLNTVRKKGLFMDNAIFTTLSYTGMRVGELVALKWKDIDFNKQTIHITKTSYTPDNNTKKYQLVPPKTKSSRRKIAIDNIVIDTLMKHKEEQEKLINHLGDSYLDKGYVFANVYRHPGYPILVKFVESRMDRSLKKTVLNLRLTPHSLRHTHTSLLAEAGVGLEEIMDRLGHHDDEVTRKVYLHVTNEMKREASDKFSKLMSSLI
ncbi:site-specific integrase [Bacillus sp. PK3-056]|uniref:tyrosine-type recombinase/integrase n=1 Tax=Niallia circulans TaxID=1397 RepID=UPI000F456838|nr:tyrosine-type recombinase/integrase [Niallia circulans]AYV72447.1 site-specific integrase [Niallia circulans]UQZ74823.1 site-specific integrase [Niallia circulans]